MRKSIYIVKIVLLLGMTGCSLTDPFVDARREAGQVEPVGSSTDDYPVICYGFSSQEEVDQLAQNECSKTNRQSVFIRKENFSCSLFMPQKAIYQCVQTDHPVPPYQSPCLERMK